MRANLLKTPALGMAMTVTPALVSALLARAALVMAFAVPASDQEKEGKKPSSGSSGFRGETPGEADG